MSCCSTRRIQAADFRFRFEIEGCLTERLDTSTGVFTKDLGGDPARTVTANISLTDGQMWAIYRAVENTCFFDYPAGKQEDRTAGNGATFARAATLFATTSRPSHVGSHQAAPAHRGNLRTMFGAMRLTSRGDAILCRAGAHRLAGASRSAHWRRTDDHRSV